MSWYIKTNSKSKLLTEIYNIILPSEFSILIFNETISNISEAGKTEERKSNLNYYDMLAIESIKSTCP